MNTALTFLPAQRPGPHGLRIRIALLFVGTALLVSLLPPTRLRAGPPAQATPPQTTIYLPTLAIAGASTPPSSIALIDQALAGGQLNADTAALYRVFALFADPRLPAAYHGDDSTIHPGSVFGGVVDQLASLATATRAQIEPFLLPPDEPGSWYARPQVAERVALVDGEPEWTYLSHPTHPLTVVFDGGDAAHRATAERVFSDAANTIWPNLTDLMDRRPRSYSATLPGRFVIYLVDRGPRVVATRGCEKSPAHVLISPGSYQRAELAALVMEAILYDYSLLRDCQDYRWLRTATAVWAADHVYPGDQYEHAFAGTWLDRPDLPLNWKGQPGLDTGAQARYGGREAGGYLLPFYIARDLKQPDMLREIWENTFQFSSLQAMNASLPGNFAQQWPLFAGRNWNRGSERQYQSYDRLIIGANETGQVLKLDGQPARIIELDAEVKYLAAHYHRMVVGDPKISTITLENPFFKGGWPTAKVAVWVRMAGSSEWMPREDITSKRVKSFCLDVRRERVTEMMVLVSNSEWRDTGHVLQPASPLQVHLSNIGCRAWRGIVYYKSDILDPGGNWHERHETEVAFERAEFPGEWPEGTLPGLFFRPKPANGEMRFYGWDWHDAEPRKCSWDARGPFPIAVDGSYLAVSVSTNRFYGGDGYFVNGSSLTATDNCGAEVSFDTAMKSKWWKAYDTVEEARRLVLEPSGRRIAGSYQTGSGTYTWAFIAAPPE